MSVSQDYLARTIERLASVVPVSYRRIFNGYGVYHQGMQFALIVNDHLYFRADDYSCLLYERKGMKPFQPGRIESTESCFYQLPEDVLANPAELVYWMRTAVEAGMQGYDLEVDEPFVDIKVRHLRQG